MRHALGLWMLGSCGVAKPSVLAPRAGKSVCLTGLPRIAGLLHVLRAERGPSPVLALAIVEVRHSGLCFHVRVCGLRRPFSCTVGVAPSALACCLDNKRPSRAGAALMSAEASMTQALAAVICEPGVKTTEGMLLRDLLQEAAALGRPLFTLFDHPAGARPAGTSVLKL